MSIMFCCGQFGCDIIEIDDDVQKYANEELKKWVWEQHRKRGEFPSIDEQSEYLEAICNRIKNIKAFE